MVVALALLGLALGLDNGLGKTPPMGYNTWYDTMCDRAMNETVMRRTADALVDTGLAKLGYRYLNLDGCWPAMKRLADGGLEADRTRFPSGGLKELADYVHAKGLLFGAYTDRGDRTCQGRPGALGHEEADARQYADWGVDYLKEDSCHATADHATAFAQYGAMRDALQKTGRPIFFSLCGWEPWYAPVGQTLGNAWRIGPDDTNWRGVLANLNIIHDLARYAGPGGWNDPCLLLSKTWNGHDRVTPLQSRAQFSMWAVVAAPLLISGSLLDMDKETLETYSNAEVIAVNQDPLGKAGWRVAGEPMSEHAAQSTNVWARPLSDGSHALMFINAGTEPSAVTCDAACFASLGYQPEDKLAARDVWAHQELPAFSPQANFTTPVLPAEGGHMMLRIRKEQVVVV